MPWEEVLTSVRAMAAAPGCVSLGLGKDPNQPNVYHRYLLQNTKNTNNIQNIIKTGPTVASTCPGPLQHPGLPQPPEVPHEQTLAEHPEASSVITLKGELPSLQMLLLLPQLS